MLTIVFAVALVSRCDVCDAHTPDHTHHTMHADAGSHDVPVVSHASGGSSAHPSGDLGHHVHVTTADGNHIAIGSELPTAQVPSAIPTTLLQLSEQTPVEAYHTAASDSDKKESLPTPPFPGQHHKMLDESPQKASSITETTKKQNTETTADLNLEDTESLVDDFDHVRVTPDPTLISSTVGSDDVAAGVSSVLERKVSSAALCCAVALLDHWFASDDLSDTARQNAKTKLDACNDGNASGSDLSKEDKRRINDCSKLEVGSDRGVLAGIRELVSNDPRGHHMVD